MTKHIEELFEKVTGKKQLSSKPTIKPPGQLRSWMMRHLSFKQIDYVSNIDLRNFQLMLAHYLKTRPEIEQEATKANLIHKCKYLKEGVRKTKQQKREVEKLTFFMRHFGGNKFYWQKEVDLRDAIHIWLLQQPYMKREAMLHVLLAFLENLSTPEYELDSDSSSEFDEKLG